MELRLGFAWVVLVAVVALTGTVVTPLDIPKQPTPSPVAAVYGSACKEHEDCKYDHSACAKFSTCIVGVCVCKQEFFFNSTNCAKAIMRPKGEVCKKDDAERHTFCAYGTRCMTCPEGDIEVNVRRCRSAGVTVLINLPLLAMTLFLSK